LRAARTAALVRIVALLTVRNEERFLHRCLDHLLSQGVEVCVVDNDSTDRTLEIARAFFGRGVFRIERAPYRRIYAWPELLRHKERLAMEIDADWFLHQDADEIREAPPPYSALREGLEGADREGFNAVNFDEFVFLPTSEEESFEGTDYVASMEYYYFFEPRPLRQVKAWKKVPGVAVCLAESGGHSADFPGRRIFPSPFVLRHYIALSRAHAIAKYAGRVYAAAAVERGWHKLRATFAPERLRFPPRERLNGAMSPKLGIGRIRGTDTRSSERLHRRRSRRRSLTAAPHRPHGPRRRSS
jgi:hypothetical protein